MTDTDNEFICGLRWQLEHASGITLESDELKTLIDAWKEREILKHHECATEAITAELYETRAKLAEVEKERDKARNGVDGLLLCVDQERSISTIIRAAARAEVARLKEALQRAVVSLEQANCIIRDWQDDGTDDECAAVDRDCAEWRELTGMAPLDDIARRALAEEGKR